MTATSSPISRRDAFLGSTFLLTGAVTWMRLPRQPVLAVGKHDINGALPQRIGTWSLVPDDDLVLPPEDEQRAAAVYEDQITRTYTDERSAPIMLVLAYSRSQNGMLMVHRPESCYPGSGFAITADRGVTIPLSPGFAPRGRFLSTERETRIEQVLYWTRLGNEFPQSWDEERRYLALQNLRGLVPDGALVRLSCVDPDPDQALTHLLNFASALFATSGRDGRALLGGPARA